MLQEISIIDRKESYYDMFLNDTSLEPYQYSEHFENLISTLNQIYKEKKVFCKKIKEKMWVTRVYLNASNPYSEILVNIIKDIFNKSGATSCKSSLTLPTIKDRIQDYSTPLNTCICIEGKFNTYKFKAIEYLNMLKYEDRFMMEYIDMIMPLIKHSKESIKVQVTKRTVDCVEDYINTIHMHKLPKRRKMNISFDEKLDKILVKFYWDWNDNGDGKNGK